MAGRRCRSFGCGEKGGSRRRQQRLRQRASAWEIATKHRLGKLPGIEAIAANIEEAIADHKCTPDISCRYCRHYQACIVQIARHEGCRGLSAIVLRQSFVVSIPLGAAASAVSAIARAAMAAMILIMVFLPKNCDAEARTPAERAFKSLPNPTSCTLTGDKN